MNIINLEIIKNNIKKYENKKIKVKMYIGRNKYEYYEGKIDKLYNNIFIIDTDKGKKSFSYSDIATKNLILSEFK